MIKDIILDLDETLICSEPFEGKIKKGFKYHFFESLIIYERPHLETFIKKLFQNFRVSIWTAAEKKYAVFIIQNILYPYVPKGRDFYIFMHREHCKVSQKVYGIIKHLSLLYREYGIDFHPKTTVIIDDNLDILDQKNFVIHIKPFDTNNTRDIELRKIIQLLLI